MISQDQQVLEEQGYLLERDYRFQLERVQKAHQEELDKLKAIEDQLRNDNFLKSKRNHQIYSTFENVNDQLNKDLNYYYQKNEQDSEEYKIRDKISAQICDVNAIYQLQVQKQYKEKNPVIDELEKELEFLEKENMDLNDRNQKLEKEIYNKTYGTKFDIFQQKKINEKISEDHNLQTFQNSFYSPSKHSTGGDYAFYCQKWNLHGINQIEQNKQQNLSALERARQIIHTDFNENNLYQTSQNNFVNKQILK